MTKYSDKRFKLAYQRLRTGILAILSLPVSIFCQITRRICSHAFIPPGFSGEYEHCESKILNRILQHECPGVISVMAFDLASDILSLINNKHIFSLEMEDERLVFTPPHQVERTDEGFLFSCNSDT